MKEITMFSKKLILIGLFLFYYIIVSPVLAFEKGLLWQIESPTIKWGQACIIVFLIF